MTVRPAQPNILTDLGLELLIYRILLQSPFEIQKDQQLVTTWRLRLYMCLMLLVYSALRVSFYWQFENNDAIEYFSNNGKLYMFADMFDQMFSALSIGAIFLNGFITNTQQIEFFQELHHFDLMLFNAFDIPIKRSRTRAAMSFALIFGLVYYFGYCISSVTGINTTTLLSNYQYIANTFTLYFANILSFLTAFYYCNCTQLCRERLSITRKLLRNPSNFSIEQMNTVLQLYVGIRSQILLINKFMGVVVLLKIAHDFALASFIVYLMCSSLYRVKDHILDLLLWLGEAVIGPLLMTLTANMLMTEVYVIVLKTKMQ